MTIRHLITVFAVLISLFLFCLPVSAECSAEKVLTECGFSQNVVATICDIQLKKYPVHIQVFSDNRSMMVEVHPNGQIMMFLLNKKGEYAPFAATQ